MRNALSQYALAACVSVAAALVVAVPVYHAVIQVCAGLAAVLPH